MSVPLGETIKDALILAFFHREDGDMQLAIRREWCGKEFDILHIPLSLPIRPEPWDPFGPEMTLYCIVESYEKEPTGHPARFLRVMGFPPFDLKEGTGRELLHQALEECMTVETMHELSEKLGGEKKLEVLAIHNPLLSDRMKLMTRAWFRMGGEETKQVDMGNHHFKLGLLPVT